MAKFSDVHDAADHTGLTGIPDLSAHTGDTSDAHDASAISVLDTAGNFTGTDVEAVLAELQDNIDGVSGGAVATDSIWDAAGDLAVGSGSNTAARLAIGTSGYVLTSNGTTAAWAAASGGAEDPVADIFGAADTAFEFETSSLSGLTGLGSPASEDADTTVPSHLYLRSTDSGTAWNGRYLASPSTPFTVIVKIGDAAISAQYNSAALIVGVAGGAGAFEAFGYGFSGSNRVLSIEKLTNRTTYSSTPASGPSTFGQLPLFVGAVVNSTSDIDFWYSWTGRIWRKLLDAHDPSMTIGLVGVAHKSENSGGSAAAFDFLRLWNSAKTFPGA